MALPALKAFVKSCKDRCRRIIPRALKTCKDRCRKMLPKALKTCKDRCRKLLPKALKASRRRSPRSFPSRSTTGSDSLNHDGDERRSVGSGPSEPFPSVCEEAVCTDESYTSNPSPAFGHRLSATSTMQRYYENDDSRDKIFPTEILCYLKLVFEGEKLSKKKAFQLHWLDESSYNAVNEAAERSLCASPKTINKKLSRTDGVCKLFKRDQEFSSKALEMEEQWSDVLHLIVAEFVTTPGNQHAKFHLEITWTYAAVDERTAEEKYSKKIADLIDSRMKTNWQKKKFIPQKDLSTIISMNVVQHLVDQDDSLKDLEDASLGDGPRFDKKKFIEDAYLSHGRLLALCVYEELPLICLWQMLYVQKPPVTLPLEASDIPRAAEKRKFDNLIIKQWYFTAHQFPKPDDAKVHCTCLDDGKVLPLEPCGEVKPIGAGGSKVVYKVQIPPGHHRFTEDKTRVFALKEFKNDCPYEDFERESKVLRKLLSIPHKHITPHYASWSQAGQFYMLSPLAECNLKDYWSENRPRLADASFVLWQLRQLRGLADAVRLIRNLGGWHHDLKGENILVFDEGGRGGPTLKIADFGSAKIRARRSGPQDESTPTTNYSQGTSAYEAPDYVIRGETSRPYDVWTLGCVYLDMLVWTFGSSPSAIKTFSNQRLKAKDGRQGTDTMFWYVDFDGINFLTHWKPAVKNKFQELEDLCGSNRGSAVFKELVLTTKRMLRMNPSARPAAYEVHNDLERITLWAEDALQKPDWNIQSLLIGATPSTRRSEAAGDSDGDGSPVSAKYGRLMLGNQAFSEMLGSPRARTRTTPSVDPSWLEFVGSREDVQLDLHPFRLVVDGADDGSESRTLTNSIPAPNLLLGSRTLQSEREALAEAQTAVQSPALSESHLPSREYPSSFLRRKDDLFAAASCNPGHRSSLP